MSAAADDEMLTLRQVGVFFGGTGKPVDQSTLYRWIRQGRLPKSLNMGTRTKRWRKSDCQKLLDQMIAERGQ